MNNDFFNLPIEEQSALIKEAGDQFDISDIIVEKDLWVCWLQALSDHDILKSVIEHKKAFFNASYTNYDDYLIGKFRLIPGASYLNDLEQDFTQMTKAGMFHELPPAFKNIVAGLEKLETAINSKFI